MTESVISLDDKYLQPTGRVFMSANQALVRLPLDQARRDRAAGRTTAGFISGYRGSPLGVYDSALWGAQKLLDDHAIVFQPGLNEELAVSAIRGTQQAAWFENPSVEGVFGLWYGKGIGVDRACESLKLGNLEGTSANGGFLVIAGDDHGGKSSDSAHQSEHTLIAALIPVLYPSTIDEVLEFGVFGWAMSRYSGCYIGLKTVTDTLDISGCIQLPDPHRTYSLPDDVHLPPEGLNLRPNLPPLVEEEWLVNYRLPAATAFVRANHIDRVIIDGQRRRLSIVSAGKAYLDVRQALTDLGLDEAACQRLGIRLYKPGLIWPMDKEGLTDFTRGSEVVLVVEEKRPVMEDQIARHLYALDTNQRPALTGKQDLKGAPLLSSIGELNADSIRLALKTLLDQLGINDAAVETQYSKFGAIENRALTVGGDAIRPAYFCSGCPHNTSTNIPEGSMALGGIGCHGLVAVVMDRNTMQFLPMGHEGSGWNGVRHFVGTSHMFQNMGDGTYSHSGLLAIRAAVAANANITYKVLYNDAVAMTGGQPVESHLTPIDMVKQLLGEGVRPVRLVSDHPEQYSHSCLPANATVHHRDELDVLQKELRDTKGVTGIVYEQTCAAEKRRRRKRGLLEDPDKRLFINPDVCEGCSDCSVQSNCISIQPLETEFGRKRRIDQSTCNKDYSCANGFCPSFVTVTGATIAKHTRSNSDHLEQLFLDLPEPRVVELQGEPYNIMVAGIGGTGVLTIGALMGMAAHLDGKASTILDMTGMAQKGGSVTSHIRIARDPDAIFSGRLSMGMTDVLIACDLVVASGAPVLGTMRPGKTRAVLNTDVTPTAEFQSNKYLDLRAARLRKTVADALDGGKIFDVNATDLATGLTGDSIGTNVLILGYAAQQGLLPVSVSSIQQAIRLNGSFSENNLRIFAMGRLAAHDPAALAAELDPAAGPVPLDTIADVLASRQRLLTNYQNANYAAKYTTFIEDIHQRVAALGLEQGEAFVRQVALTLGQLMAYKDEYEVARLYSDPLFMQRIKDQFSGNFKLSVNLAPPMLPGKDASGRPKKREFGPWIFTAFNILQHFKHLRGTVFDPIGYTRERRMERQLIAEYRVMIETIVDKLRTENITAAIELARTATDIAGYGPIKDASVVHYTNRVKEQLKALDAPAAIQVLPDRLDLREIS
ncbi:MAG: indolepyruvate ferredoxin oxidoreductase family protein [Halioglobus sp.]|nr:indolepyruvate ferredoxin oxidoreductase family protein [Halioglobus sp.]